MALPKQAIEEFKEIYKKETGIELDDAKASEEANSFFEFMKIITKPIVKKNDKRDINKIK